MINKLNIKKSKRKYWYKKGKGQPFNKCKCGNFKQRISKKCFICAGFKKDGTFKKKKSSDKIFLMNGYFYVCNPKHYRATKNGYVGLHILVAEKLIKRKLRKNEIAHHINKIRNDNRPENIKVMTKNKHNHLHNPKIKRLEHFGEIKCVCGNWKKIKSKFCCGCKMKPHKSRKIYITHKKNLCSCGNLKDDRYKRCRKCADKLRWKK